MRIRDPRNYLIKKGLQLGLTVRFLLLSILFALFIAFEVYISIWPIVMAYVPKDLIGLIRHQLLFRSILFAVPIIFIIGIIVIIFSHRIAGPIYNIEQKLKKLADGEDAGSIKLRKGDEFQELAEAINKLIPMLKSRE